MNEEGKSFDEVLKDAKCTSCSKPLPCKDHLNVMVVMEACNVHIHYHVILNDGRSREVLTLDLKAWEMPKIRLAADSLIQEIVNEVCLRAYGRLPEKINYEGEKTH